VGDEMSHDTQPLAEDQGLTKEQAMMNAEQLLKYYAEGPQPTAISVNPLHPEGVKQVGPNAYEIETPGYTSDSGTWVYPLVDAISEIQKERTEEEPPQHIHGPFTFLMNANHNALRGCISCGQTWVGAMAGHEENLRWHIVTEPEEEE
jgi:predicted RNase H-like HicB family nuclease